MQLNRQNTILLASMAFTVFVVVAALLVRFVPGPLRQSDYLVIGAISTLAALGTVFGLILKTEGIRDIFFKRRKKE